MVVGHRPVPYLEALNPLAHTRDRSCHLMPEDTRRRVRPRVDLLQVRPADPAGINVQQYLAGTDLRHRHRLHPHIVDAAVDGGHHRPRHARNSFCHNLS